MLSVSWHALTKTIGRFMKPTEISTTKSGRGHFAFTQIDLLVVLLTVGILFLILFPALAGTHSRPQGTLCTSNLRQLSLGWLMYANENNGKIMSNPTAAGLGYGVGANTNPQDWVNGFLSFIPGVPDNTNTAYLVHALMGPYCNYSAKIFKCPSDIWKIQEGSGWYDRVRSYSMNYCMEGDGEDALKSQTGIPVDRVYWDAADPRYGYHRLTDIGGRLPGPTPANAWVFCDEHPNTINNGALSWGSRNEGWTDLPASYHQNGDNFSFADGHVEYHKWLSSYNAIANIGICAPVFPPPVGGWPGSPITGANPIDMDWVTSHGSASYP